MPYSDKERFRRYQSDYRKCNRSRVNKWRRESAARARLDPIRRKHRRYKERIRQLRKMFGLGECAARQLDLRYRTTTQCDACRRPSKVFHVDHDHVTGAIRGILCSRCNLGLGHFGDSVERLQMIIDYLIKAEM